MRNSITKYTVMMSNGMYIRFTKASLSKPNDAMRGAV
jgi:hypothetical protein